MVLGVVLAGRGASGVMVEVELVLPNVFASGARWVSLSSVSYKLEETNGRRQRIVLTLRQLPRHCDSKDG